MPTGSTKAKPTLGYPSKLAAVCGLAGQGLTARQIAERLGCKTQPVHVILAKLRTDGRLPPLKPREPGSPERLARRGHLPPLGQSGGADTRGIWTPEKLSKARRLFGKTMMMIAEALEVPPKELLEYGLKGVIPPMGVGQRLADLIEGGAAPQAGEALALPAPDADERAADEAALAALEVDPPDDEPEAAPPAPGPMRVPSVDQRAAIAARAKSNVRYRLRRRADGLWLHMGCEEFTAAREWSWLGFHKNLVALLAKRPELAELELVAVMPEGVRA